MIRRSKELNTVQQTYPWFSAFPNATNEDNIIAEKEREEIRKKHFGEPIHREFAEGGRGKMR